jgi:hypothetical protein
LPILPWPSRRACPSPFRALSCTSAGHHASPGFLCRGCNGVGDLCGSVLEIGVRWHGPHPPRRPLTTGSRSKCLMPSSFCISSHSQHEPTAMYWRGYSSRSCAGDPLLVIDHRIMLDVEFVPGPSLLSSFRAFPGTESVSWGESHGLPCLKSVSVWQLHKTELFEGMYSPKFQCLHPSCANVL